jgi:radical SAM protein with 4Fe4S-binding SPASM domain
MTDACNFSCPYCIAETMRDNKDSAIKKIPMDLSGRKALVKSYLEYALRNGMENEITIAFNGGECLLEFGQVRDLTEYALALVPPGVKLLFRINTNSSLVTDDISRFLVEHSFAIITSLDGPKQYNDMVRIKHNGSGTYDEIVAGIRRLVEQGNIVSLNTVLSDRNYPGVDEKFLDFVKTELGCRALGIEPDLVHAMSNPVSEIAKKLESLVRYGKTIGLPVTGMYQRVFSRIRKTRLFWCLGQGGGGIDVDPRGEWSSCGFSRDTYGRASEFEKIVHSGSYLEAVGSRRRGTITECKGCDFEGPCGGGCYSTFEAARMDEGARLMEYRCGLYRAYSDLMIENALDEYMSSRGLTSGGLAGSDLLSLSSDRE